MTKVWEPAHTAAFVNDFYAHFWSVFHNVRHFKQVTQLEVGPLGE